MHELTSVVDEERTSLTGSGSDWVGLHAPVPDDILVTFVRAMSANC